MSERWLTVCEDLLTEYGPVFTHKMSGSLERLEIKFTGGIGDHVAAAFLCRYTRDDTAP